MYRIIFLLVLLSLFTACEEVIDVELDDADPQIVIEAKVSDNSENNIALITLSTDFYEPSEYEKISEAEVIVTEVGGESFIFSEISSGKYSNKNLIASVGSEYLIAINFNDIIYSAKSSLRQQLTIDSLQVTEEEGRFSDNLRYEINCYFQDNPEYEDFARFKVYVNGEKRDGVFTYDDRLSDGNSIEFSRFRIDQDDDEDKLKPGDLITIELLTIDEATYEYFNTLSDVIGGSGGGGMMSGSTPANPTTNWDNDALGYFSAYSIDTKSIVIQ
jgi:Domain of unknown function (DUF4249)